MSVDETDSMVELLRDWAAPPATPGPWFIGDELQNDDVVVTSGVNSSGTWVATVKYTDLADEEGDDAMTVRNANARLIAAAPDLYEALSALWGVVLDEMDQGIVWPEELVSKVRGALDVALNGR